MTTSTQLAAAFELIATEFQQFADPFLPEGATASLSSFGGVYVDLPEGFKLTADSLGKIQEMIQTVREVDLGTNQKHFLGSIAIINQKFTEGGRELFKSLCDTDTDLEEGLFELHTSTGEPSRLSFTIEEGPHRMGNYGYDVDSEESDAHATGTNNVVTFEDAIAKFNAK